MKTMISGAGGFIGQHLVRHLIADRPQEKVHTIGRAPISAPGVTHSTCDMADSDALTGIIERVKPDRVYHLAGSSRVNQGIGMPEYFASNFLTTTSLLKALARAGKKVDLFFASSVHVYGNLAETAREDTPPHPAGFYGFSKFLAEEALRNQASKGEWLRVVVGRLYSCIGPGQPEGFVASDLCRKIGELPAAGQPVLKTGALSSYRRFLDVRDAVKVFPRLLDLPLPSRFEIFNIASPHELQIARMVEMLLRYAGKSPKIESADDKANPFTGLKVSVAKLNDALPSLTFRPIDETLREMLAWAQAHKR